MGGDTKQKILHLGLINQKIIPLGLIRINLNNETNN